jgi:hypothetical protein
VRGIRYSQLSGFKFYLIGGLVASIPYLLAAPLIFAIPDFSIAIFCGAMILSTVLGYWEDRQEFKAGKTNSPEWKAWDNLRDQASLWDFLSLMIFFDSSKETKQD